MVSDRCVVWVHRQLLVSCPVMSQSPLIDETPGRGLVTIEFLLEDLSLGRYEEFRENPSLHLVFLTFLQLKRINVPKRRTCGCLS